MKLKATISLPGQHFSLSQRLSLAEMVQATNSGYLHEEVYKEVLAMSLRVGEYGPAEYFTQQTDRMTRTNSGDIVGVDVALSGVSVTTGRAQKDFWDGLQRLHEIYSEVATLHLVPDLRAQVFTRMALDSPISYLDRHGATSLLEKGPTTLNGLAIIREATIEKVVTAELECLIGDKRTLEEFLSLIERNERPREQEQFHGAHPERGN